MYSPPLRPPISLHRGAASRQSDGTAIAAQYAREGVTLRPANMDRINGWAAVLQGLGDPEPRCGLPIRPRLFNYRRCGRLMETSAALQHDPSQPEDVIKVDADEDGVAGDDAADVLRYLVATTSRIATQRKLRGLCGENLLGLWKGSRP